MHACRFPNTPNFQLKRSPSPILLDSHMKATQTALLQQLFEADIGSTPITLRALLPTNLVGSCIGRGGDTHRDLERQFGTSIYFGADNSTGYRLASIAGNIQRVARTWRECAFLMFRTRRITYSQKLSVDILIPAPLVDKLSEIPENGYDSEFTEIALLSGATMVLKKDTLANSTERPLQIFLSGLDLQDLLQFENTIRLLGRAFQKYTRLAFSPDNIYYIPGQDTDLNSNRSETQENHDGWSFAFKSSEKESQTYSSAPTALPQSSSANNGDSLYVDNFMETSWAKLHQQNASAAHSSNTSSADTTNQRMRSSQCTVRILVRNSHVQALFRRDQSSQLTIFKQMSNRYAAERMHITPLTSTPCTVPRSQFCYLKEPNKSMNWTKDVEDLKWPRVIHFIVELDKVSGITADIARLLNGEIKNAPESLLRLILSERAIQCLTCQKDQLDNLRSVTSCNIWICDENLGESDERVIIITGHSNRIGEVVNKIFTMIHSKMRLADIHKPIRNYVPVENVPPEDPALSGW